MGKNERVNNSQSTQVDNSQPTSQVDNTQPTSQVCPEIDKPAEKLACCQEIYISNASEI